MWTGYERASHRYFMKASSVRPGDFIEFFAEIDLIGALSACPGGDCGAEPLERCGARCLLLKVEIFCQGDGALRRLGVRPEPAPTRLREGTRNAAYP